jgi:hypothetical protein
MRRRRRSALSLLVLAALIAAAALTASAKGNKVVPMEARLPDQLQQRLAAVERVRRARLGARPADDQQLLVEAILRGLPPDFVDVKVGSPPEGFQQAPQIGEVGTRWVYVTVRARDGGAGMPFARWEAELVAGALREASHAVGLPDVLGSTTTVLRPDGISERSSGVIAVPFGERVATEAQAGTRIRNSRDRDPRLRKTTLTFVHALHASPVVITTLPAMGSFQPGESVAAALLGPVTDYEGAFVMVRDPNGRTIRAVGYASTTGVGFSWSDSAAGSDTVNPQGAPSTG